MFYADIEAASANRVAQTPLFVAGQNDKRDASGFDGAEFGDREVAMPDRISSSIASKPSSTLSSSSINSTQGRTHSKRASAAQAERNPGPLRLAWTVASFHLPLRELHIEPLEALIKFAYCLFSVTPL